MTQSDYTTDIYNYFLDHWPLYDIWTSEYRMVQQHPVSDCKMVHKAKLGKQTYCIQLSQRNWVWEHDDWRVYISTRGLSFEVKEGLTLPQVCEAWRDYLFKMTGKQSTLVP